MNNSQYKRCFLGQSVSEEARPDSILKVSIMLVACRRYRNAVVESFIVTMQFATKTHVMIRITEMKANGVSGPKDCMELAVSLRRACTRWYSSPLNVPGTQLMVAAAHAYTIAAATLS